MSVSHNADYLLALDMQRRWNNESDENDIPEIVDFKKPNPIKRSNPHSNLDPDFLNRTQNLVHPQWETLDPTPDIFALFNAFDAKFFQCRLKCVTLEWSTKMYSCAGICYFQENRYGRAITIRLSEPLLKLRPRKDMVETMLHEMIHAYCFTLNIREGNGGHGPNFKKIMYGINKVAGTNITVYHSFHDEVEVYRQHWWRCNGSCQNRAPFFGYVKRTSNRAPGPNDQWWKAHMESCGGTFMKIKSPEDKEIRKSRTKKVKTLKDHNSGTDLRNFFPTTSAKKSVPNGTGNKINGFTNDGGSKGPFKTNGGGTIVVNPKKKHPATMTKNSTTDRIPPTTASSIATAFPPTSYPGLSTDPFNTNAIGSKSRSAFIVPPGGNLKNVVGFNDLNSQANVSKNKSTPTFDASGSGYSLTNVNDNPAKKDRSANIDEQVDRNHLRELWTKRFGSSGSGDGCGIGDSASNSKTADKNSSIQTGDVKRRRLSIEGSPNYVADDTNNKPDTKTNTNAWVVVDDDVMLQDKPVEVIALSSSDNDSDDSDEETLPTKVPRQMPIKLSANERQIAIKQEILDGNADKTLKGDDIILIDDDYDDDEEINTAATELADTSLIDDLFGEDTLLKEFKRENDVVPSSSRHLPKPEDDIITCPVCQGKMKRSQLSEHLDGCTGIAVKVQLSKTALQKLAKAPVVKAPRKPRKSKKDILRDAGYTEEDLVNITSTSSSEEDFLNNSDSNNTRIITSPSSSNVTVNLDSPEEFPRRHRQRNLFKSTRQCPVCAQEIEEDQINEHLDECLK